MLILVPFVIIILIILAVDAIYFSEVNIQEEQKAPIIKEDNKSQSMQDYFEKYIQK